MVASKRLRSFRHLAFCDAEELRLFTRAEIEWRSKNAPDNLRLDLKTNETGARECGWGNDDGKV